MLTFLCKTDLCVTIEGADPRPELDRSRQYGWLWHYPLATLTSRQHKHERPSQGSPRLLIIKKLWLGLCSGPVCTNTARRRGGKWNGWAWDEVSINVRERRRCLDCKLLLADSLLFYNQRSLLREWSKEKSEEKKRRGRESMDEKKQKNKTE